MLANYPGVTWVNRLLTSLYGRMGDLENSAKAARSLLDAHPGLTLQSLIASVPPATIQRNPAYIEGLRAAGIR